jgi:hypothetical protein
MAQSKRIAEGDHISKIAADAGFGHWQSIWDANAALKKQRANPNLLFHGDQIQPGDELAIPDAATSEVVASSGGRHRFVLRNDQLFLRIRILKADFTAIASAPYALTVDGTTRSGSTDSFGQLEVEIPRSAQSAELVVRAAASDTDPDGESPSSAAALRGPVPLRWSLNIGALNPIMERAPSDDCVSGVQQRLSNLAFYRGAVTGVLDDATRAALRAFQTTFGLPASEASDQARTQPKLRAVHDALDSVLGRPRGSAPASSASAR